MEKYSSYVFIVAIIGVFYFLIIRPQQKRQKDQAQLMSDLKPGAEIVTIGGLYGTIVSIDDDRARIAVADGTELEFAKKAIAHIVQSEAKGADDGDVDADEADDADEAEAANQSDNQPDGADV
jgi:preprotein translocase subunit YajC